MSVLVSPSLLSGNFARICDEVLLMEASGADFVHCDVMDGMFVPSLTFGNKMIADFRKYATIPLDVHLMIVQPERYLDHYMDAGAGMLSFHLEATKLARENLVRIRERGIKSGLAICPDTPVKELFPYFGLLDFVVMMGVHPGFGGQSFIQTTLGKIIELKREITLCKANILIEMDGGLTGENAKRVIDAGTDIVVSGSAFFAAADKAGYIRQLKAGE